MLAMTHHLQTIVEMQQALDQLDEAERRLHGIPDWMRELHDQHAARQAEIAALEQAMADDAKERRAAEGAIQDAQEKLMHYQQQINKVSTQREYGALLQEIDTVKALIASYEDQGLAALERSDRAQKELDAQRESFRELAGRYAAELAKWEGEKPAVARQVADLRGTIGSLKERLPKNLVSQFERIRERNPAGALARIRKLDRAGRGPQEWHCGACNYRVRPQVVVEIRNTGSLVQCDACKRILYLEEEPA
jgi:uncharacterized protein